MWATDEGTAPGSGNPGYKSAATWLFCRRTLERDLEGIEEFRCVRRKGLSRFHDEQHLIEAILRQICRAETNHRVALDSDNPAGPAIQIDFCVRHNRALEALNLAIDRAIQCFRRIRGRIRKIGIFDHISKLSSVGLHC